MPHLEHEGREPEPGREPAREPERRTGADDPFDPVEPDDPFQLTAKPDPFAPAIPIPIRR